MGFRITVQTLAVLRVLLDHPLQRHYGLEVAKAAGLPSGSLYPILARLEQQGWLTSDPGSRSISIRRDAPAAATTS